MAESKRVFIKSKNKNQFDNTKTIYFDEPFVNVKEIKLNSIQVHNSFDNISESLGNNKVTFSIYFDKGDLRLGDEYKFTLDDGFYTIEDLVNLLNQKLNDDKLPDQIKNAIKIEYSYYQSLNKVQLTKTEKKSSNIIYFKLTGKFLSLLGFESTDLKPLPAESDHGVKLIPYTNLYVNCNLFNGSLYNGKRSNILCSLPIDQSKRWWDTVTYNDLKCNFVPYKKDFNFIELCITDRKGNHIDFNGYPIIYELEITSETVPSVLVTETKDQQGITIEKFYDTIATKIANRIKEITDKDTGNELDTY